MQNNPCKATCQMKSTWDAFIKHYGGDCTKSEDPKTERFHGHIYRLTKNIQRKLNKLNGHDCEVCN